MSFHDVTGIVIGLLALAAFIVNRHYKLSLAKKKNTKEIYKAGYEKFVEGDNEYEKQLRNPTPIDQEALDNNDRFIKWLDLQINPPPPPEPPLSPEEWVAKFGNGFQLPMFIPDDVCVTSLYSHEEAEPVSYIVTGKASGIPAKTIHELKAELNRRKEENKRSDEECQELLDKGQSIVEKLREIGVEYYHD